MTAVAEALGISRKRAGLKQKEVAAALGITVPYLSDMENGRRAFVEKYLCKLPKAMKHIVAEAMIDEHKDAIIRIEGDSI